jgi:lipopolysaccharide export LptBFGC system permease protein LptF
MFVALLLKFLRQYPEVGLVAALKAAPVLAPMTLPITLPLAFLVACLLTYGRFTDDNEYLAFRMGGIHPWHALSPTLVLGVLLSIAALPLNTTVVPLATLGRKEIGKDQFLQLARALEDPVSHFAEIGRGGSIVWQGRDGPWLTDVTISGLSLAQAGGGRRPDDAPPDGVIAARCRISMDLEREEIVIELRDLRYERVDREGNVQTLTEEEHWFTFPLGGERRVEENRNPGEMRATELIYRLRHGSRLPEQVRKWEVEYWRRLALSLAPLAFALFGAPLGLILGRRSRMAALLTALIVALPVYYPLLELGDVLGTSGALPASVAMNLGNGVLVVAGLWLSHRTVSQ